jgi:CDP-4-dehydro-6-deoxyglucose reductase, E1
VSATSVGAGRFYYVEWPHSDVAGPGGQKIFKGRPALAIAAPDQQGDLTLLKVTGQPYPGAVRIEQSDLRAGKLKKPSYVRVDRALTTNVATLTDWGAQLHDSKVAEIFKALAVQNAASFSRLKHQANRPGYGDDVQVPFTAGETVVPYAGRVFTEEEVEAAVSSTLDFWLTLGPEGEAFEQELASFLGIKRSLLVNSGSSANLVAFSALTSPKLGERQLLPGDEVITVAAGFPTTVAPILQNGCVPVFIDNDPLTLNGRVDQLEEAFSPGKTKAVMMAHTLGNPFDLSAVTEFCKRHNLWLIEDNCDALGCRYDDQLTGTFGDLSTQSFYPPHHLTMGEGGAVNIVRNMQLKVLVESFRDWGRDCWCASGKDNTCNKRFGWQLGELPHGYDHKYIYSHLGYNLKPLDPQAAIGRAQLRKLPDFVRARSENWETLRRGLAGLEEFFEFHLPTHATGWDAQNGFTWDNSGHRTHCSWFGFMMLVRPNLPFTKTEFARHLDERKIGNRMLFGGNLLRQPAFVHLRKNRPDTLRIVGDMSGADRIMNEAIFIGVYPGLTQQMLSYIVEVITAFCRRA